MTDVDEQAGTFEPTPGSEFEDYPGELTFPGGPIRWSQLTTAPVLRGAAAFVIGIALVARPRTARLFGLAVAAFFLVWAIGEATDAARRRDRSVLPWLLALALLGAAAVVFAWPDVTERAIAGIVGCSLLVYAAHDVYTVVRGRRRHRATALIGAAFLAIAGIALLVIPGVILELALLVVAAVSIIGGIAAIVTALRSEGEDLGVRRMWDVTLSWIEQRPHTSADRRQLYGKLFFEGAEAQRRLSRFFLLMGFAAIIAAYGVASDSTAVVVGAMLIAPLMTPLMAIAVSIVMGWPKRAAMSGIVALGGILLAIFLGWLIAAGVLVDLDPVTNSQVAARINPTLIDIAIALAAGGAGAFALSRPDVSDALPGVAVAISLVPPLVVTGEMLRATQYEAAGGALLLFGTNAVAILLAGAVTFILTGVVPIRLLAHNARWIRSALLLVGGSAVVILIALTLSSRQLQESLFDQTAAEQAVADWVGDDELDVLGVTVTRSTVHVEVAGPDEPPPVDSLGQALEEALDRPITVEVDWVADQRFVYEPTDG